MVATQTALEQFHNAVERLAEVLAKPKDEFMRDSSIKRFELCYDLAWKSLKSYLEEYLKIKCSSPKACFREAYTKGVIQYEQKWLKIADDRNDSTHQYKEAIADALYERLPQYLKLFQQLERKLKKETK